MISLRHVARRSCRQLSRRSFTTSRQKRALNEQQLGKPAVSPPPPAPDASASGGGGGSTLPIIAVFAAAGGAGAYYMDLIPDFSSSETLPVAAAVIKEEEEIVKKEEAPVVQKETEKETKQKETKQEETKKESAPVESTPAKEEKPAAALGNRVLNISLPIGSTYSAPPKPITEHPFGGNRVTMEPVKESASTENAPSVNAALKELQRQISQDDSTRSLIEAHKDLATLASMDLSDLDKMSMTQLKIRLVQMAKDMEERTKWEAVRLKEFLAMKEREVEDK
jgi:outer membrane biosynthesis protein TonB